MSAQPSMAMVPAADTSAQISVYVADMEPDSATAIRAAFDTMFQDVERWSTSARSIRVTSVDQVREMRLARETRLALREIRIKSEHARKRLKEDSTRRGKAIDGIANVLAALVVPLEDYLREQETFAERAELARKTALGSARADALRAYGANVDAYGPLGDMAEETWVQIIEEAREAKESRDAAAQHAEAVRVEAERIAAENRAKDRKEKIRLEAERVEREKEQAAENARLRSEVEAREASARVEREAAAKALEDERAATTARERVKDAEAAADRKVAADALQAATDAADKVRRELAAKELAELREKTAQEAAAAAALTAPDREKLAKVARELRAVIVPPMATGRGSSQSVKIALQIDRLATWVEELAVRL